jgi:hypothetical protein
MKLLRGGEHAIKAGDIHTTRKALNNLPKYSEKNESLGSGTAAVL